jgi:hexosaminidase
MKNLIFIMSIALLASCSKPGPALEVSVIPKPQSVVSAPGKFVINEKTIIVAGADAAATAQYLQNYLMKGTGLEVQIKESGRRNTIVLEIDASDSFLAGKTEAYTILSTPKCVTIKGSDEAGLFYGVQTLLQMLPPEVAGVSKGAKVEWSVAVAEIKDNPVFHWRGIMLDCSRHFFAVSHIKNVLDQAAALKINHFHWHLCDDQGWRIEIKKYPELTTTSAWRVDRENLPWNERPAQKPGEKATYGGFYTQDEIRDVVAYAAALHIEVIPEIEMPAHASAVFAAYPQLNCQGKLIPVPPGGVWPITDIYCAGNDEVFTFLEDVLSEVMTLFPSKYIHVGGDEATKTNWEKCPKCNARIKKEGLKDVAELQSYFIKRMEKFLNSKGKNLIGWDEILEGGLAPEATVMSWRGFDGGIAAAKSGHDVVMSPTDFCYIDYYQGPKETEPLAIGGYLPLSKVYQFVAVPPSLTPEEGKHILGGQVNLWAEFVPTPEHSFYMIFPRLDALAEVTWTSPENRNYDDFVKRVERHFTRLDQAGVNHSKDIY